MKITKHRRLLLPGGRIEHTCTAGIAGLSLMLDKLERTTKKLQ